MPGPRSYGCGPAMEAAAPARPTSLRYVIWAPAFAGVSGRERVIQRPRSGPAYSDEGSPPEASPSPSAPYQVLAHRSQTSRYAASAWSYSRAATSHPEARA